jgi:hypothetical protein
MKKMFLPLMAIAISSITFFSCEKGIEDPLVDPLASIQHPDSTLMVVTVPAGTTGTVKMVGNMIADYCDDGTATGNCGWQPGSDVATVIFDQVSDTRYEKKVAVSLFTKDDFEFKFVNGNSWDNEELKEDGTGVDNRKASKGSLKGKAVDFTVVKFK